MADYDTLESSVEESRPIEVYDFALGITSHRFTSAEDDITLSGNVYMAEPIERGPIGQGSDEPSRDMIVTVPADNAFANQYVNIVPGEKATLSIIRLQRDESPTFNTQVLVYKGQVQSVRFPNDGHVAEINCRTIEVAAAQRIPRYTYMSMCGHVLYGPRCKVLTTNFNHIGAASNVDVVARTMDIAGLAASGLDVVGGYATPTTGVDFRMITAQSGDTITLLLPFPVDQTGANVQVFAGCDHTLTGDCALTFDNVLEFGGFPFVPNKNIFQTGID